MKAKAFFQGRRGALKHKRKKPETKGDKQIKLESTKAFWGRLEGALGRAKRKWEKQRAKAAREL